MYSEDDLLPLSALQHFVFCRRQCALIHIEGLWYENRLTAEGRLMHQKVDDGGPENRNGIRIERSVLLVSRRLGLVGKSDVVEFHPSPDSVGDRGEIPFPVEYKRGRPKPDHSDLVQLSAQALCLEEMTGTKVPEGAIFYGQPRRRIQVPIDTALRHETEQLAMELHRFIQRGVTPAPAYEKKCDKCSFLEICMPKSCSPNRNVGRYIKTLVSQIEDE